VDLWDERAARNEALFREVNERIAQIAGRSSPDEVGFVCECSDEHCTARIHLSLTTYEAIRSDPRRFVVAPGHETSVERIVEQGAGYTIVEKIGVAGRISEEADPRA
jgi:hypothetical protein